MAPMPTTTWPSTSPLGMQPSTLPPVIPAPVPANEPADGLPLGNQFYAESSENMFDDESDIQDGMTEIHEILTHTGTSVQLSPDSTIISV